MAPYVLNTDTYIRASVALQMGQLGLQSGNYETAITAARMALGSITRADDRGRARLLLGTALLKSGKPDDAEVQLEEALGELSPTSQPTDYATALATLGEVKISAGDLDAGINRLENSLLSFSTGGDSRQATQTRVRLADLYEKSGRYPNAAAHLEVAAQEFASQKDGEDEAKAWNQLAGVRIKEGDREGALAAALKSTAALPDPSNQKQVAAILGTEAIQAGASGKEPLEGPVREGFWGRFNPFALKRYLQRGFSYLRGRVNELDELTAANSKMIKDTDARATEGIRLASSKTNVADQHAIDAGNKAQMALETATQANTRLTTVEQVIGNIEQYKAATQTEIRFRPGQSTLSKNAKTALDDLATPLKNQRGYIIEVQGFSSGRGQAAIATSQKMADSVVRYLVLNHDIPVYRIYVVGMGNAPAQTAADNSKAKWPTGGRVEIRLLKMKP
jgi:outer membrane protein OmpA-like peptidoglycan-associated protein